MLTRSILPPRNLDELFDIPDFLRLCTTSRHAEMRFMEMPRTMTNEVLMFPMCPIFDSTVDEIEWVSG